METKTSQPSVLATRRGKLILALSCAVGFLDFVDASIVNIALPSIRLAYVGAEPAVAPQRLLAHVRRLHAARRTSRRSARPAARPVGRDLAFCALVPKCRAGDDLGRPGGLPTGPGCWSSANAPGCALLLTTTFKEGGDRTKALGVWGGVGGLASAVGVLLGGVVTQGPGWRWVFFVNPPLCLLVLGATFWLISGDQRHARLANFDLRGAVLSTGGMLPLVYSLVRAPVVGWASARTVAELAGALVLLAAFVANEQRRPKPLVPLSIFRTRGLAPADVTQLAAFAGIISMFFFLTLYMQEVLRYSPIRTGLSYLPVTVGVGIAAGASAKLVARTGTRPVIVAGALIAAGGVYYLSRIAVHGSYLTDILPGMVVMSLGLGAVFVGVTTAANAGVAADKAGLAASLLNASQQLGAALGLAIFSAIATAGTNHLLAGHTPTPNALTSGFSRALLAASIFLLVAAVIATRTHNAHGDVDLDLTAPGSVPDLAQGLTANAASPRPSSPAWSGDRP